MLVNVYLVILDLIVASHCGVNRYNVPDATFASGEVVGKLESPIIDEASGLCASRRHPGVLYTNNDSGDINRIYAISSSNASLLAMIYINGTTTQDWEDIACGPCAGGSGHCIYIADTGGNAGGVSNIVFRVREPELNLDPGVVENVYVRAESELQFSWNQNDCETIMVDPQGNVYIVSKVNLGERPWLVQLPSSAWGTNVRVNLTYGAYLPISVSKRQDPWGDRDPVAGDISPSGREVLVKTYFNIYYWSVPPDGNITHHLSTQPDTLPYINETKGEAVCFDHNGNNYYTLGEGRNAPLYLYRRLFQNSTSNAASSLASAHTTLTLLLGTVNVALVLFH